MQKTEAQGATETPPQSRAEEATERAVDRVREERKLLGMMARVSKGLQRPLCHPGRYMGSEGALITLKAAGMVAEAQPGVTINLFVQGIGTVEASGILQLEKILLALSEGKGLKAGLYSAGIIDDPLRVTQGDLKGIETLLGSLPTLARILLGKEEG